MLPADQHDTPANAERRPSPLRSSVATMAAHPRGFAFQRLQPMRSGESAPAWASFAALATAKLRGGFHEIPTTVDGIFRATPHNRSLWQRRRRYQGDADIGLSYDDVRHSIRKTNPDVGDKVIVFNITGEIPNDIVAVRTEIPDDLKAVIDAHLETDEGEAMFDEIYDWTSVRRTTDSEFDIVRDAAKALGITEPPG